MNIGDSEEAQQIMAFATKPDNLSSISRTYIVKVENHSSNVSFDFYIAVNACTKLLNHFFKKKKKQT